MLGGARPEKNDFPSEKEYEKAIETWKKRHEKVVVAGGLHVLGTERHESRRIDNQLRGRSGRQGDPGSSRFFVSLEDEIMRLFGGDQISKVMEFLKIDENQPIEHGMISKAIEQAQVKVEGFFFDQRKRLVEFDDVMNKQREVIYARRRGMLLNENEKLREHIMENIHETVVSLVSLNAAESLSEEDYNNMLNEFNLIIPFDDLSQQEIRKQLLTKSSSDEIQEFFIELTNRIYNQRVEQYGEKVVSEMEKFVMLSTLDEEWMEHLDDMDNLREGIWLRGDKQAVLSAYKKESYEMFESLMNRIDDAVVKRIYRIQAVSPEQQSPSSQAIEIKQEVFSGSIAQEASEAQQIAESPSSTKGSVNDFAAALGKATVPTNSIKPGIAREKIGRNDPCPCGSGKKYKKCHGINI